MEKREKYTVEACFDDGDTREYTFHSLGEAMSFYTDCIRLLLKKRYNPCYMLSLFHNHHFVCNTTF